MTKIIVIFKVMINMVSIKKQKLTSIQIITMTNMDLI